MTQSKLKLTPEQQRTIELANRTSEIDSFAEGVRRGTMRALYNRGLLQGTYGQGLTSRYFILTEKGREYLKARAA